MIKIKHEKLGELNISYYNKLIIEIEGNKIKFKIENLGEGRYIARFNEKQTINGAVTPGLKLTENQYYSISNFHGEMYQKEQNEYHQKRLEEYKNKIGFSWLSTEQLHIPYMSIKEYSYKVIKRVQEVIKERYEYSIEPFETPAGTIGRTTVKKITGAEILEILEEISAEFEKAASEKLEESRKNEERRINALKEKAMKMKLVI